MSSGIFIQARLNSTRLPAKALLNLNGRTVLERVIQRCSLSGLPVFILTSIHYLDDAIEDNASKANVAGIYRGSIDDVRSRFLEAAKKFRINKIIRVTADNPFTEPVFMQTLLDSLHAKPYCRIRDIDSPLGVNSEAFTSEFLMKSTELSKAPEDLEHVTPWMRNHQVSNGIEGGVESLRFQMYPEAYNLHLGIDTIDDYWKILQLCKGMPEEYFESLNLLDYMLEDIFNKKVEFRKGRRYEL